MTRPEQQSGGQVARLARAAAGAAFVCALAWLAGFDFNERGGITFLVATEASIAAGLGSVWGRK